MNVLEAFHVFGIDPNIDIEQKVQGNFERIPEVEESIRSRCLDKFKELAKACHPDLGGDPAEMRKLIEARDIIKQFHIQVNRPQPVQVIRVYMRRGGFSSSTDTSSSTFTGTYTNW